jgi:hypothetical protein
MTLTEHSTNRLLATFAQWHVEHEYHQHVTSYLVHGFDPGSFYTAVFANDFAGAMRSSHPGNQVDGLKNLAGWMQERMPRESWGSREAVKRWLALDEAERRAVLEYHQLVYDTKTEMWLVLKDEPTTDPYEDEIYWP